MSSEPTPVPSVVNDASAVDVPLAGGDVAAAAAPLKPLLNPLQASATPPASTIVEPPQTPNPQNPAAQAMENGAEPSAGVVDVNANGSGAPVDDAEGSAPIAPTSAIAPPAQPEAAVITPATPISREDTAPPPLPIDAPVPPSPPAPKDEEPPVLSPDAIPPAVPTPTVITTESPAALESTPAIEPVSTPVQNGNATEPSIVEPTASIIPTQEPVPAAQSAQPAEAMDVDQPAQAVPPSAPGLEPRGSEGSLKRAGETLEGREEKRVKEESAPLAAGTASPAVAQSTPQPPAQTVPAPVAQPLAAPPPPVTQPLPTDSSLPIFDPNGPAPPWLTYTEPAPRPAGPSTPLTITQHKHLLSSIRALKKIKEAANFLEPVNVVLFGIPHYAQIITKPMDLGTVEQKLIVSDPRGPPKDKSKMSKWDPSKGNYRSVSEVVADVRQIWENTRKFNGPNHVVSLAAKKLDDTFEKMLRNLPAEPAAPAHASSPAAPSPAAGPSHPRRPSVSQVPAPRRSSDGPDSSRPKREIHPPPSKDLGYNDGAARKPKRRNDPQLQWASRTLKSIETAAKNYNTVTPFLYPVEEIIKAIPQYADVIRQPIDLLRIRSKLDEGEYEDVSQVDDDIRLMVRNAQVFNPREDPVHIAAAGYLELWNEKWRNLPPKQEARDLSEDPLADDFIEDESDEEDGRLLQKLEEQVTALQAQIADIRARRAQRRSRPPKKGKAAKGGAARKQSLTKASPGPGANGHAPKKPRKSRDAGVYKEDEEMYSEEETGQITLLQKQELAEKIGQCDPDTLGKAIQIIQQTTDLGSNNEEIELDIDTLPARTVTKLYNLVVRGGRKAPKNKNRPLKKTGRKATGGANRKFMNEDEEADRIRKMEAQLQSFDAGKSQAGGFGYDDEGDDSSEEESSDED
ncbi:putative Bromodomain transcription initiation factor [Papiliotrema laurentii]|uniref:Bromodomain transcription initiation factor n=1 Tax=Papiliotrema laurentii TaxID=5418 RepID=A0AAD9FTY4_PAPLA|nr:putative Bromodomain transcription initiation factor [Papiliotrema laurentii]